jgi:hypothetical protein
VYCSALCTGWLLTSIDPPGAIFTEALDINSRGQIVGRFSDKSILKPEEASVQRSHGSSAVSEAADKRSAFSFVMGLPSGAKY